MVSEEWLTWQITITLHPKLISEDAIFTSYLKSLFREALEREMDKGFTPAEIKLKHDFSLQETI